MKEKNIEPPQAVSVKLFFWIKIAQFVVKKHLASWYQKECKDLEINPAAFPWHKLETAI